VEICEEESCQQYMDLEDIQMGHIKAHMSEGKMIRGIPAAYLHSKSNKRTQQIDTLAAFFVIFSL
jgi:hypothetical protein